MSNYIVGTQRSVGEVEAMIERITLSLDGAPIMSRLLAGSVILGLAWAQGRMDDDDLMATLKLAATAGQ